MTNVLLIHGMWSSPEVLSELTEYFRKRGHRVEVPTLPQHVAFGEDTSEEEAACQAKSVARLSLKEYCAFLKSQVESYAFDEAPILVGHSMGGLLAQMLSQKIQVKALLLLNSAGPSGINHIGWTSFRTTLYYWTHFGFFFRAHRPTWEQARYGLLNGMSLENAKKIYSMLCYESGRSLFEIVLWFFDIFQMSRISKSEVLEKTSGVPVAIVSGGQDRIVLQSVSKALLQRYPHAQHFHYADRGHWLAFEEGADEIFEDLNHWISGVVSASKDTLYPKVS
jgi:pimeloyl-ACP methyl ester carboxylesterase